MFAVTATHYYSVIQQFSVRLTKNGQTFKVAITACMGKIMIILNTMLRDMQHFWCKIKYQERNEFKINEDYFLVKFIYFCYYSGSFAAEEERGVCGGSTGTHTPLILLQAE